jgi:hypothetical protein
VKEFSMSDISTNPGYSFDAAQLFAPFSVAPAPAGEIILRVPRGISPVSLRQSDIGKQLIHQDVTWFDEYPWAIEAIAPGVYHLRLPVPGSNGKNLWRQNAMLLDGEDIAPLVLVELALLCLKRAGLPDPLNYDWVRCQETAAGGGRVALYWRGGRLRVNDGGDRPDDRVWLAAVRAS